MGVAYLEQWLGAKAWSTNASSRHGHDHAATTAMTSCTDHYQRHADKLLCAITRCLPAQQANKFTWWRPSLMAFCTGHHCLYLSSGMPFILERRLSLHRLALLADGVTGHCQGICAAMINPWVA